MQKQKLPVKTLAQLNCLLPDGLRFYNWTTREVIREKDRGESLLRILFGSRAEQPIFFHELPSGQVDLADIPSHLIYSF